MKSALVSTNECKKQNFKADRGFAWTLEVAMVFYDRKNDIIFFLKKTNPTVASST